MKENAVNFLKYNRFFYNAYFYVFSILVNLLKLFIKTDDKLILFNSFGGKKFDDSPRAIFEYMLRDERFRGYKFVWGFHNPSKWEVNGAEKIKTDFLRYYIVSLQARCWISNSGITRGLHYRGKNTFYLDTSHGSVMKKMGEDMPFFKNSFRPKLQDMRDAILAESTFEVDMSVRNGTKREKILMCGYPRNDELVRNEICKSDLLQKLGLPSDKKIILYAPTWRDYARDAKYNNLLTLPIRFKKWKASLGNDFILLFRAHYATSKVLSVDINNNKGFVYDVSNYTKLNELMILSDMLISDYSSIFIDYAILEKPMLCFGYDYEEYCKYRGLYLDLDKEIYKGIIKNEDILLNEIKNLDYCESVKKTIEFKLKHVEKYGGATKIAVDYIYDHIK